MISGGGFVLVQHKIGIDNELYRGYGRSPEQRVQPEKRLSAYALELSAPGRVEHRDYERFSFEADGGCDLSHLRADGRRPPGEYRLLAPFIALADVAQQLRQQI